jgi:glycosyltransferase involved in cell wall biosynthesis/aminoglycoside phosphotransferase
LYLNKHLAARGDEIRLFLCDLNPDSAVTSNWPFPVTYLDYEAFYTDPARLVPELKGHEPDVLVMSNSQLTAQYGRALADAVNATLIYEMHDDEGTLLRSIKRPTDECDEAASIQVQAILAADAVIVFSAEDAAVARAVAARSVAIVPCGIELDTNADDVRDPHLLAFVGNLFYEPNRRAVEYLLTQPFRQMLNATGARLAIYGRYPTDLQTSRGTPAVKFHGPVPMLRDAIRSASIGLAPLDSGGGMKLKVLEYMSASIPVVGTNAAAAGFDHFDEFALRCRADLSDFPAMVERLLRDDVLRTRLGQRGREIAQSKYAWETLAGDAQHAYGQIRAQTITAGRRTPAASSFSAAKLPYWLREWSDHQAGGTDEPGQAIAVSSKGSGIIADLAEAIACAHISARSATGIAFPRAGTSGYAGRSVVYLADEAVLKIYTHRGDDRSTREAEGLRHAAAADLDFDVPRLINQSSTPGALSWVCWQRIDGNPVSEPAAMAGSMEEDLGRLAAQLHYGTHDPTGRLRPFRRQPSNTAHTSAKSARTETQLVQEYRRSTRAHRCGALFVHGDFSTRNVLTRHGRVSGVIDFERSGCGCPYHDLASFFFNDVLLGHLQGERFLAAYEDEARSWSAWPIPIDREHLRHHTIEYSCWALEWAPSVDHQLAADIRRLAPRLIEGRQL